jgi:protein-S-isoprenylcysteine O-methyltransferase Ste14
VRYVLLLASLLALGSFAWSRRSFFRRTEGVQSSRRGLGPLGTVFGVLSAGVLGLSPASAQDPLAVVALVLILTSTVTFWAAVYAFKQDKPGIAFHGILPAKINTKGPYRYVRHPIYVAYMLYWIGVLIAVPSIITAVPVLIMGWYYNIAAQGEEREILASELGDDYEIYRARTGMFIPRLSRLFSVKD